MQNSLFTVILLLICNCALEAAPLYSVTDLGDYPGGADHSQATAINATGQVIGVGQNASRNRAFLTAQNTDGTIALIDLGALSRLPSTFAHSINDRGQVVGASSDGDKSRSFLWNPSGPNSASGLMMELEIPGAERNHNRATAINARGQIVGYSVGMAYLWSPASTNGTTGTTIDLGGLPGGLDSTLALGINDFGQVVGTSDTNLGSHAFLWTPTTPNGTSGSMIDLGTLPGATGDSQAIAINAAGAAVGYSVTANGGQHAVLWGQDGTGGNTLLDLGRLEGGNDLSAAYGINATNEVVGYSNSAGSDHAFYWSNTTGMVDLNSRTNSTGTAWVLRFAQAINDRGQIAGFGEYDPDGPGGVPPATHAFRLEPIAQAAPVRANLRRIAPHEDLLP